MNKFRFTISTLAIATFVLAFASMTQAQATRTWVSGVGDDANPCSRTAPCKTFAGAISKTATDGEIDALDPGGFGAVTITKAITIDGSATGMAGILNSGVTGIIINLTANSGSNFVQLRNISMNGGGTGTNGIRILSSLASGGTPLNTVSIENCVIFGNRTGNGRGISDERTVGGKLYVLNTIIKNNSGIGAVMGTNGAQAINAVFDTCQFINNNIGLDASTAAQVTVVNSTAALNTGAGFFAESSGTASVLNLQKIIASHNGTGVQANPGGTVRISDVQVTNNAAGLNIAGGTVNSYGNNNITGNTGSNGPPNGTPITQQ